LRSSEQVEDDVTVALFIGSDWDHKGLAIALDAVARARSTGLTKLDLWVVGRGDRARFQIEATRLGIADAVRFFGFRRDTERFYQAADVFVFPSAYETFSLVSFEAAASGLPIVSTHLNGVEELLGMSGAGYMVQRRADAFAEALAFLAMNQAERRAKGEVARARATDFTWERSTRSVLALYSELLRGAREARAAA
jgi:glycosyltransferase involved in cell wall biosynthesis